MIYLNVHNNGDKPIFKFSDEVLKYNICNNLNKFADCVIDKESCSKDFNDFDEASIFLDELYERMYYMEELEYDTRHIRKELRKIKIPKYTNFDNETKTLAYRDVMLIDMRTNNITFTNRDNIRVIDNKYNNLISFGLNYGEEPVEINRGSLYNIYNFINFGLCFSNYDGVFERKSNYVELKKSIEEEFGLKSTFI